MSLTQLYIRNIRIIHQADLRPCPGLNIVYGLNAAGKTSLLEAIDILSRGRSFRSRNINSLLTNDQNKLLVSAEIIDLQGQTIRIGIEKSRKKTRLRYSGRDVNTISTLATAHPVQAITPESHQLVNGGPGYRRAFLDWGVFHVKPSYHRVWSAFQRSLKQRNAALKSGVTGDALMSWNNEFVLHAEQVNTLRLDYFQEFAPCATEYLENIVQTCVLGLTYKRGWPEDQDLKTIMEHSLVKDRILGFTQYGPHRADINIKLNDQAAVDVASRGQQKLLVASLLIAQAVLFQKKTGKQCVLLADDLNAELDNIHCETLLTQLAECGMQVFITALDAQSLNTAAWESICMFHVEHGVVREVI